MEKECRKALDQIREKNYAENMRLDGVRTILKYGITCNKKKCCDTFLKKIEKVLPPSSFQNGGKTFFLRLLRGSFCGVLSFRPCICTCSGRPAPEGSSCCSTRCRHRKLRSRKHTQDGAACCRNCSGLFPCGRLGGSFSLPPRRHRLRSR